MTNLSRKLHENKDILAEMGDGGSLELTLRSETGITLNYGQLKLILLRNRKIKF